MAMRSQRSTTLSCNGLSCNGWHTDGREASTASCTDGSSPSLARSNQAARRKLSSIVAEIDRSPGYLARFVSAGRSVALAERDNNLRGGYLGVGPMDLGIRDLCARS